MLAVTIVLCALIAADIALRIVNRPKKPASLVKERLLVTLVTGEAFEGLLVHDDATHWELAEVLAMRESAKPVPADGRLFVPVERIAYAQRR